MKKILFFGELPSTITHGISLANQLNIDILGKYYEIMIIQEKTYLVEHKKRSFHKIQGVFQYCKEIYNLSKVNEYSYFYSIFSLSTFGSLKILLCLLSFRIGKGGKTVLQVHRGDFNNFHKRFINKILTRIIFKLTNKIIVLS